MNVSEETLIPWYEKAWTAIKNMALWKKIVILIIIVLLVALVIIGNMVKNFATDAIEQVHVDTPENYDLSLVPVDGYINILALGVDSRDMENVKGTRSDMIMIASINTETYDVKLTSVYRDTFTKLGETSTYDKITHACAYGGPEMTMKTLNQMLDIDISQYVVVNFKAVADLVDAVGGIEVDVQQKEIQQLNKYTKQTAKNIGKKDYNLVKSAGVQTLEGVQAVSYGRIRKGVGDDIKRTERMRTVVNLTLEKLKTMSFSEIKEIVDLMLPQVQTNLELNDILALGIRLPKYNITFGESYPYNWKCGTINSISYLFSSNYAYDTRLFHQKVFGQASYTPSSMVQTISDTVAGKIADAKKNKEIEITDEQTLEYDPTIYDLNQPIYDDEGNIIGYEFLEDETGTETGTGTGTESGTSGDVTIDPGQTNTDTEPDEVPEEGTVTTITIDPNGPITEGDGSQVTQ